jgi:hypothetical protein
VYFVNDNVERVTGYSPPELLQELVEDLPARRVLPARG